MKKKRKNPFKNIKFGAVMFAIGIIWLIVASCMSEYNFGGLTTIEMAMPTCHTAQEELKAICDNYTRIYGIDNNNKVKYFIDADKLGYDGKTEFRDIVLDNDGTLYVSARVINNDAYLIDMSLILSFDQNGEFIREICRYDYRDKEYLPIGVNPITALNLTENSVRYVYKNNDGSVSLISANKNDSFSVEEAKFVFGEYNALSTAGAAPDGSYGMILVNGDIVRVCPDGTYTTLLEGHFILDDPDSGFFPQDILAFKDHVLLIEGLYKQKIYNIYDGETPQLMYTATEMAGAGDNPNDFHWNFKNLEHIGNYAAVSVSGHFTEFSADGFIRNEEEYRLPARYMIHAFAEEYIPAITFIFLLVGFISLTGCLMHWRMNLIFKQLMISIPLFIAMGVIITVSTVLSIMEEYENQCYLQMRAVLELSVKSIDGDMVEGITDLECANDGSLYQLNQKLREIINYNRSDWSGKYNCCIRSNPGGSTHFLIASSEEYNMPFIGYTGGNDELVYTSTLIYKMNSLNEQYICAATPIYNSAGEQVAFLELTVNYDEADEYMLEACTKVFKLLFVLLLIFISAEVLLTYISGRYLRKTKKVVSTIAQGDFSVRIEKSPHDEIGEICTCVNEMASQLEDYFNIKDKNERFYYKFVPEKFRELLHKNEFTDLSLGDAQNADLTVLFCDIRAFSLNSEMMTAKESFEFVNKIYGKAGPIIRSCNGFVDKYIGDAVMALFENADDAVKAGMEIYRKIVLDPSTAKELGVSSFNIGIGIHSGMARVGIVGEEERMSGTVISNTVNLSSRLESLTKRYNAAMLISKDTLDRMKDPDSLNMRYLGMVQVAGVNEVIAVYEILECLDEERKRERTDSKMLFRDGVREFHLGHVEKALSIFEQLEAGSETDPAPKMYADILRQKLETGDQEHNVFRFARK